MEEKRLRRILALSKRVESARKGELSNARSEAASALQQLEMARREERACLEQLSEAGEIDVHLLETRALGLVAASAQVQMARSAHTDLDADAKRREALMYDATREVRKFEILWDRAKEQQRIARKNLEQQTLDETRRTKRKENS